MMRAMVLMCLLLQTQAVPAPAQPASPSRPSIVCKPVESPVGSLSPIYFDESVLFVSRAFGDRTDGTPSPEPGLFVNSKEKGRWLLITAISTLGAKLGRSWSDDPEVQRVLRTVPVSWDFVALASRPYMDMPLRTSGSIAFPDKIVLDTAADQYELHFFSALKAATAETVLYVRRVDLLNAFAGRK